MGETLYQEKLYYETETRIRVIQTGFSNFENLLSSIAYLGRVMHIIESNDCLGQTKQTTQSKLTSLCTKIRGHEEKIWS